MEVMEQEVMPRTAWGFAFGSSFLKSVARQAVLETWTLKFHWQVFVIFEHQQLLEAAFAHNLYWQPFLQVIVVFKSEDQHCCSFAIYWPELRLSWSSSWVGWQKFSCGTQLSWFCLAAAVWEEHLFLVKNGLARCLKYIHWTKRKHKQLF